MTRDSSSDSEHQKGEVRQEHTSSPQNSKLESEPRLYPRNDHCVSRSDIDPDALKIMYRLIRHGFKAYMVGGGVRDLLLGKKPKDFDIATDATPRKIKGLFRNCRIIGRRFKLVHIYFRNQKIIEVSTFRDISDPVEAEIAGEDTELLVERNNTYGTPATDAFRRDLTINALFYELSSFSIIDYVGGMKDLKDKTIRVIGDAKTRYLEDPVRMLRAVRHAARAGFTIEKKTYRAIQENHHLLESASQVRVYEELRKDFTSGASLPTLRLLAESGLMEHLLPELLLNDSVLLKEGSYFSEVFERIDAFMVESDDDTPTTSILAVIALFLISYPSSFEMLSSQNTDRDELNDHLKSCFIKLMVPRKERERIDDLLGLWLRLLHTPIERAEKLSLERRKSIEDLDLLLTWLGDDKNDGKLHEIVKDAVVKKSTSPAPKRRRKGDQKSSPNPRRNTQGKGRNRKRKDQ